MADAAPSKPINEPRKAVAKIAKGGDSITTESGTVDKPISPKPSKPKDGSAKTWADRKSIEPDPPQPVDEHVEKIIDATEANLDVVPEHVKARPGKNKARDALIDTGSPDFKTVASKALEHVDVILPKLFPGGEVWDDGRFHLLNPRRDDRNVGSFSVNMATGQWADFSAAAGTGAKGGDLISSVAYCRDLEQHEAAAGLDQMLGIGLFDHADAPFGPEFRPLTEAELKAGKIESKARSRRQSRRDGYGPSIPAPYGTELDVVQGSEGCWPYFDEQGRIAMYVLRKSAGPGTPKHFYPFSYREAQKGSGHYRWIHYDPDGPLPLYRLDQLALMLDASVLVCEGEKTADAAALSFPEYAATTTAHGAKSPGRSDWSPLKGRTVTIWPDHDQAGKYAEDVTRLACAAGALSVSIVQVPDDFPDKWDLADPAPEGADLRALLASAVLSERPPDPAATKTNGDGQDDTYTPNFTIPPEQEEQALASAALVAAIEATKNLVEETAKTGGKAPRTREMLGHLVVLKREANDLYWALRAQLVELRVELANGKKGKLLCPGNAFDDVIKKEAVRLTKEAKRSKESPKASAAPSSKPRLHVEDHSPEKTVYTLRDILAKTGILYDRAVRLGGWRD